MKHLLGYTLIAFTLAFVGCDNEDTTDDTALQVSGVETEGEEAAEATEGEGEETAEATEGEGEEAAEATEGEEAAAEQVIITTTDDFADGAYMDFMPEDIAIPVGTTVTFEMTSTHNAIEVSQETYENRGSTPLEGGFTVNFGETKDVTFDEAGVYYYVCQPHVGMDMIGTITVE